MWPLRMAKKEIGWGAVRGSTVTAALFLGLLLEGCMTVDHQAPASSPQPGIVERILAFDLKPRFAEGRSVGTARSDSSVGAATYYGDTSPAVAAPVSPEATASDPPTTGALGGASGAVTKDQGYEMNFEDTPIGTVAKAVLGDILGVGYAIDTRVKGTVSLSSGRPVAKKDILYVLENALRVSGIALVRDGRDYRLVPAADALGSASIDKRAGGEAGYGITVVPLQFVSAPTVIKLLENFAAKPGMVRAEPSRNLLIIQGNGPDRRSAVETVLSFDADWMRGQSVGIYPVSNSTPEPIIAELERIIDAGEGGLSQNLVKLQPIARQNAVLVVTRRPELLDRVATWIRRLDRSGGAGTGVKVYRMRYGDARQVAALLNDMFLGAANGGDAPTNQLAPGSGVATSSSGPSASSPGASGFGSTRGTTASPQAGSSFDGQFADASAGRSAVGTGAAGSTGGRGGSASATASSGSTFSGALLTNVRIAPDVTNNALLIYANQESYRVIEHALQQIDRPQLQVAIDATIAEVTLNDELSYGVQFYLQSKDIGLKPDQGSALSTLSGAASTALVNRVLPGFNFLAGTEANPRVILDALRTVTDVKVLSTPSVVVIDNQFASLLVGDQIPITTRTAQSVDVPTAPVVNNIDYRNTGVILKVAPRINANGTVLLDVDQEISSVANTPTAGTLTPTVSQRKIRSSIAVNNGQTVVLGGLISERTDRSRSGIPGLEQLPVFGDLFAHNDGTISRTELIIFIRPKIIRNGVDAARVAEELRGRMRGIAPKSIALQPPVRPVAVAVPPPALK